MINQRNDRNILIAFIVLIVVTMTAGVTAQTDKTGVDSSRDLSRLARYAWLENYIAASQPDEVTRRMEAAFKVAVNQELEKKGYRLDPQNPDFFIHVVAGPDLEAKVSANRDYRLPIGTTVYTSQRPDGWGVSAWLETNARTQIVATDSSNAPLWQGEASKKFKDTDKAVQNMEREIGQIVSRAIKTFPHRKK